MDGAKGRPTFIASVVLGTQNETETERKQNESNNTKVRPLRGYNKCPYCAVAVFEDLDRNL